MDCRHFVFQNLSYSEVRKFNSQDSVSTAHISNIKDRAQRRGGEERALDPKDLS